MSANQSESDEKVRIESANDLKIIRGIGPAIERKLNTAGIFTYVQLAAMSSKQLASLFSGVTLLSEDRIIQQDWVGQARVLAEKYPAITIVEDEAPQKNGQHYAVFTVELLLDGANAVRRTRIMHVQTQEENTWAGWDDRRLAEYLSEKAGLSQSLSEVAPFSPEMEMQAVQTISGERQAKLSGQLQLKSFEASSAGSDLRIMSIAQNQPYEIHLVLYLTRVEAPLTTHFNYATTVYAKNMRNGFQYTIGEAEGIIEKSDEVKITIKGSRLPVGTYRLEAIAMISPPADDSRKQPSLMAMLDGQIVEVY